MVSDLGTLGNICFSNIMKLLSYVTLWMFYYLVLELFVFVCVWCEIFFHMYI